MSQAAAFFFEAVTPQPDAHRARRVAISLRSAPASPPSEGAAILLTKPVRPCILLADIGWRVIDAVPSMETPRVHHAARRRGGGVAARRPCAAAAGPDAAARRAYELG